LCGLARALLRQSRTVMTNKVLYAPSSAEKASRETGRGSLVARAAPSALSTGVFVGVLLNGVMTASIIAANYMPRLEPYAAERNAASYALFAGFSLIPVIRFLKRPAQMLAAGLLGWVLFVLGYAIAGLSLPNLFDALRTTPLEASVQGSVLYGLIAAVSWDMRILLGRTRRNMAQRKMRRWAGWERYPKQADRI
jgi:hypothetical protein